MFMLIIWLQGIWLPRHGYTFAVTPLWAGIYIIPLYRRLPHRGPDLGHPVGPLRPIHLDHAGGAGDIAVMYPQAEIVVHEAAAPVTWPTRPA